MTNRNRSSRTFGLLTLLALCALLLDASPAIADNECITRGVGVSVTPTTLSVPEGSLATYDLVLRA